MDDSTRQVNKQIHYNQQKMLYFVKSSVTFKTAINKYMIYSRIAGTNTQYGSIYCACKQRNECSRLTNSKDIKHASKPNLIFSCAVDITPHLGNKSNLLPLQESGIFSHINNSDTEKPYSNVCLIECIILNYDSYIYFQYIYGISLSVFVTLQAKNDSSYGR